VLVKAAPLPDCSSVRAAPQPGGHPLVRLTSAHAAMLAASALQTHAVDLTVYVTADEEQGQPRAT